MTILHIANSYGGTDVYTNLYTSIDNNADICQWVYVPLNSNNHNRIGKKIIPFRNTKSRIHYSTVLTKIHSYLYGLKIRTIVKDIEEVFDMSKVDVIHAGTLCLDGAVAYEIYKKYGIPYISAVRNTDVDTYYKKLPWRHAYFSKVICNARRIVFISPRYKDIFIKTHLPSSYRCSEKSSIEVIPNGVNPLFLANRKADRKPYHHPIRVVYIGAFNKRKGLAETIMAVDMLRDKGIDIELNAIGKGLPFRTQDADYCKSVDSLAQGKAYINLQEFMSPESMIPQMRESDIFVMASAHETFGLVYVEALSQGLPIVYAKNEGFDGFYKDGFVGYPSKACDKTGIAESLESIIKDYDRISGNISNLDLSKDFEWNKIAQKYIVIYNQILESK